MLLLYEMDVKFESKRKRETHTHAHRVRSLNFNGNVMPFLPCYKAYLKAILIKSKHSYFDDLLIFCVFDVYSSLFIFPSKTNRTADNSSTNDCYGDFIWIYFRFSMASDRFRAKMHVPWNEYRFFYFRHCHSSNKWIW